MKIGLMVPYSGEFPGLKRALLNTVSSYAVSSKNELIVEYIGTGEKKTVAKAIDKLFYNDDVDVIIGYIGYPVMTGLFEKISHYTDKKFIHLSLGEVIPFSASAICYPTNYDLVSLDSWKSIAFLANWVAEELSPSDCLICTSIYDAGYSLTDSFRIGYHSQSSKTLQSCILNNPPKQIDVSGLFQEIRRIKPEHLHIILCGLELDAFIKQFGAEVDYTPSVSFAFPVKMGAFPSMHPSMEKTFTCLSEAALTLDCKALSTDPFSVLFEYLANSAVQLIEEKDISHSGSSRIIEMNLNKATITKTKSIGVLPESLNAAFNYSSENAVSAWQNPYLCI